jgi:hypothetical protein
MQSRRGGSGVFPLRGTRAGDGERRAASPGSAPRRARRREDGGGRTLRAAPGTGGRSGRTLFASPAAGADGRSSSDGRLFICLCYCYRTESENVTSRGGGE